MDESRDPGGTAPGDSGGDNGRQAEPPAPLPDWPAADIAWRPREADWAAEAAWSDLDTRWAAGAVGWGDAAETKRMGGRAQVPPHARAVDLGAEPASRAEPDFAHGEPDFFDPEPDLVDAEPALTHREPEFIDVDPAFSDSEPADPRAEPGDAWRPPVQPDHTWADLSARYPELLPPLYRQPPGREGYSGSNGVAYGRAHAQPVRPVEPSRPAPVSPPGWPADSSPRQDRDGDGPRAGRPAIPQPRPAAPADQPAARRTPDQHDPDTDPPARPAQQSGRREPEAQRDAEAAALTGWAATGNPGDRLTERSTETRPEAPADVINTGRHVGHRPDALAYEERARGDRQHRPADWPGRLPSDAADAAGRGEPRGTSGPGPVPEADASLTGTARGGGEPSGGQPSDVQPSDVQPSDGPPGRIEPSGGRPGSVEVGGAVERWSARSQPVPVERRPADPTKDRPSPLRDASAAPRETPAEPAGWSPPGAFALRRQGQPDDQPAVGRVRRLPSDSPVQAVEPMSPGSESAPRSSQEAPPAPPSSLPPPAQPAAAHAEAPDAEALPQRIPAEPDVPTAPEPAVDTPAETPELARIASHLRRPDSAPSHERPEGFDVNDILAAVRGVPGVADASLRTTRAGAHKLRLDLAEGADSAEVSRRVARLLQERMGLAAAPHDADESGEESAARAEPGARLAAPAGVPSAALAGVDADEPVPRRRRSGTHRGRVGSGEGADTAAVGTAVGSAAVGGRFPGGQLTAEPVVSRPLRLGTQPGPRVRIEHVQVSTYGLEANVEVRLGAGEQSTTGLATGPAVDSFLLRLCAAAAASAVDELLRTTGRPADRGRCFVEQAAVMQLGSCEVATVVVLLVYDGWVEQLAGSALVSGDPREAVVRATLAAINRRLEALLS